MDTRAAQAFQRLIELQLIDAALHAQAQSSARFAELNKNAQPVTVLTWLRLRGLLSDEAFEANQAQVPAALESPQREVRASIVARTRENVGRFRNDVNHGLILRLMGLELITQAHGKVALEQLPREPLGSPAAALLWMRQIQLLTADELQQARRAPSSQAQRVIEEFDRLASAADQAGRKAQRRAAFPGGVLLWGCGALTIAASLYWVLTPPTDPPGCTDMKTLKLVDQMVFRSNLQTQRLLRSTLDSDALQAVALTRMPSLHSVREVGYARADRLRGCVGQWVAHAAGNDPASDVERPFGFTVQSVDRPSDDGGTEHGFEVAGTSAEWIEHQFGQRTTANAAMQALEPAASDAAEAAASAAR